MNEKAISQYRRWKAYLRGALLGFVAACSVSIFPVVGIKKSWQPVIDDKIEVILLSAFAVVFTISASVLWQKVSASEAVKPFSRRTAKRIIFTTFGGILFFLLFFSANALSLRLSIGAINTDAVRLEGIRYAGLICALLGLALQLVAVSGFARFLRLQHPCCFATLIFLAGTPLAFGSWFALFALPGTFVVMKWAIANAREESQEEPDLDDIRHMLEHALAQSVLAAPNKSLPDTGSNADVSCTQAANSGSAAEISSTNAVDSGSAVDISSTTNTADSGSAVHLLSTTTADTGSAAEISPDTANQITDSVSECESSTVASDQDSGAVISIKSRKSRRDWQIIPFLY